MTQSRPDAFATLPRRSFLQSSSAAIGAMLPGGWRRVGARQDGVEFFEPGSPGHQRHQGLFNTRFEPRPAVIALCQDESGVVAALHRAREQGLPVAVRSGGHSFEGFSSNDGGMVVDLSAMNTLHLDAGSKESPGSQKLVSHPATTLETVLRALLPAGRLLPLGSCGGVGLGGLTLGGGHGMFSRSLGLTCDSLQRVQMVSGRGDWLDSKDDPDLLWACRGGGNGNFGVVTRLLFRTHPAPRRFHSTVLKAFRLGPERAAVLADRWFSFAKQLPREAFSAFVLNGATLTVLVTCTSSGLRAAPPPEVEEAVDALGAVMDRRDPTRSEPLEVEALSRYFGRADPLWFKNASAGYYDDFEDLQGAIEEMFRRVITGRGLVFQINTLGGAIEEAGDARSSAYPHRAHPFLGELQCYPQNSGQRADGLAAVEGLLELLHQAGVRAHYRNYPEAGLRDWAAAYYGEAAWVRLQGLKSRWDPDDLVRHPQSVRRRG